MSRTHTRPGWGRSARFRKTVRIAALSILIYAMAIIYVSPILYMFISRGQI